MVSFKEGEEVKLLKCLLDEIEPFKAEISKKHTVTTTSDTKLHALRFIAHLHGIKDYNTATADDLMRKLKALI